jgi:pimeloyl-ACP methyl ester carboxylesterase
MAEDQHIEQEPQPTQARTKKRRWPRRLLIGLIIFVVLFSVASMIGIHILFGMVFAREPFYTASPELHYADVAAHYPRTPLSFASGSYTLKGYLYGASVKSPHGLVFIAPGIGGSGEEGYMPEITWFVDHGWKVLAYDDVGVHESAGSSMVSLTQSRDDLDAALAYAELQPGLRDLHWVLFGHSWGGYAVATALPTGHQIDAVVSVAGYATPDEELFYQAKAMLGPLAYVEYPYLCLYNLFADGPDSNQSAIASINATSTPTLIVQGSADTTVGTDGPSIYAHRGQITNPNVQYSYWESPGQNRHTSVFLSAAAAAYEKQVASAQPAVFEALGISDLQTAPLALQQEYLSSIDKARYSAVNDILMQRVESFYEKAVQSQDK